MRRLPRLSRALGGGLVALLVLLGAYLLLDRQSPAPIAAMIAVPGQIGARVMPTGIGVNVAVWDGHLRDAAVPSLLRQAGVTLLRYPGGATADAYHWKTHSLTPGQGGFLYAGTTLDWVVRNVARPAGAQTMVTVNYGSNEAGTGGGDPAEAAAWVYDANLLHHDHVTYWEIGNEPYGNGYYGSRWEIDLHADHSPTAYAAGVLAFSRAMKAIDPTIKVGLALITPGTWPAEAGPRAWNPTVLARACSAVDFVSLHWYAQQSGAESDAALLASTTGIDAATAQVRSLLGRYCGAHAASVRLMVTETNSVTAHPSAQTTATINGLFLLDDFLAWLGAGVDNVSWWNLHNGAEKPLHTVPSVAGSLPGDFGILSSGGPHEPVANTPFPTFAALRLLHELLPPGARFMRCSSTVPELHVYAVQQPGGRVALVLLNTNGTRAVAARFDARWLGTAATARATRPDSASLDLMSLPLDLHARGSIAATLAPHQVAVITFQPGR